MSEAAPMSVGMMIFAVAMVGAQLALAVIGAGGIAAFLSHPPLVALLVVTAVLVGASFFTSGNMSSGQREDRGNRWVLAGFFVLAPLFAYLPAYTDRIGFWTLDGDAVRWAGIVLYTMGGVLRLWPVFALGRRFSGLVAIQPGHTLVTDGVYRIVRNPSYLGLLVGALGWALTFRSIVGVIITALFIPLLVGRIHSEEKMLRSQFGGEYDAYCARTWRLFPGLY
jgi:protein-S-isoprenylcysteine O-methyltransferase Ste14